MCRACGLVDIVALVQACAGGTDPGAYALTRTVDGAPRVIVADQQRSGAVARQCGACPRVRVRACGRCAAAVVACRVPRALVGLVRACPRACACVRTRARACAGVCARVRAGVQACALARARACAGGGKLLR